MLSSGNFCFCLVFMFETNGIIKEVFDARTFGKGFVKREFILSVRRGDQVEDIKFECHGDKADLLDSVKTGDLIQVQFYIAGREWNGKHFVNLVCFGLESEKSEPVEEEAYEMILA